MPSDNLRLYKSKRNFAVTPEPAEEGGGDTGELSFVIQKHWASRLHYDFRLELDGTMKSWAVPKGPSFDPKDKRMAVHVEDHPISYSSFEGTIPAKQYGAGKVIIWDKGTWRPVGDPHRGYREGDLKFELTGHKLRGKWVLVRMKGKGEKQEPWLLIKEKDQFTRPATEFSVVDEMPDSVHDLGMPKGQRAPRAGIAEIADVSDAKKAALPKTLSPQLATLVDKPPADPLGWVYEIKFDGYRILARIDGTDIRLITRRGNDWTSKLTPLQQAFAKMKLPPGWYDGEIVVPNKAGLPDFGLLQQSFDAARTGNIVCYLFDLPFFDGRDLRELPLERRRAMLQAVLEKKPSPQVRFSAAFDAAPESVVASACELGLEGVIGKRLGSAYQTRRSADWIKLKCGHRQEFVIGGFTDPQGSRLGVGSLLLGVHDKHGVLRYAGNVGTGFNDETLLDLRKKLDARATPDKPFAKEDKVEGRPHWVKPTLVAEVSFGDWTHADRIRHSVFKGLRDDKDAKTIVREKAVRVPSRRAESAGGHSAGPAEQGAAHVLPARFRVTNPERVIDASTGTTKIELVRYYGLVGKPILEHLKGRPVSLVRAPTGVGGELFFQKHAETDRLPGVRQLPRELYPSHPSMLEVYNLQGLLSAAQWNVIEFHTLNTGSKSFEHPDRMVFDLDPGEGVRWPQVQEAAALMHSFLDQLGLASFLKTSGGKGLHVVVPLRKVHDWDTVKDFSQAVVTHVAQTIPQRFVAKSGAKNRVGKIFIDYLRNGLGATTACAWSARARPGLGISVPVDWSELPGLRGGDHWSVRTAHTRLDKGNDPWAGYAKAARSLSAAMKVLDFKP
jgi:bifunctional non-homologous end joining protein LigD